MGSVDSQIAATRVCRTDSDLWNGCSGADDDRRSSILGELAAPRRYAGDSDVDGLADRRSLVERSDSAS
jgi:hypothetical protein